MTWPCSAAAVNHRAASLKFWSTPVAGQIERAEVGLCAAKSSAGRAFVPFGGVGGVAVDAESVAIEMADIALGSRIALARQRQPFGQCRGIVAGVVCRDAGVEIGRRLRWRGDTSVGIGDRSRWRGDTP